VAETLVGMPGPVSIRPEKITLQPGRNDGGGVDGDHCVATGVVGEVVYLGASTHSVVDLDAGGRLTVLQQKLESSHTLALDRRGAPVTLSWRRTHVVPLGPPTTSQPATDPHHLEETP